MHPGLLGQCFFTLAFFAERAGFLCFGLPLSAKTILPAKKTISKARNIFFIIKVLMLLVAYYKCKTFF